MGINDAAEMLQVALEENARLERDNLQLETQLRAAQPRIPADSSLVIVTEDQLLALGTFIRTLWTPERRDEASADLRGGVRALLLEADGILWAARRHRHQAS